MPVSPEIPGRRPLPDAHAIRRSVVPEAAPPYDDADPAGSPPSGPPPGPAGVIEPPFACPAPVTGSWPSQFAQVLSEALAGSRPASQLTPWTTDQARKRISQLGPMLARPAAAHGPRVRRVIVTSPVQDVLEMTVIVDIGARARAIAVRLERPPDPNARRFQPAPGTAWLCTAIEAA